MDQEQQHRRPGVQGETGAISLGEALQVAGQKNPNKPIDLGVVSAIRSAEGRATGVREGLPNGPAYHAQQVLERRTASGPTGNEPTLGQVLSNAMNYDMLEKPVNLRDAQKVQEAEMRNSPTGNLEENGIAQCFQAAADYNVACGHVNPNAQ